MPASVVLTTVPNTRTALKIAERLIRKKVASCVSVVGGVRSVYRWKGKIERSREALVIVKTDVRRYPALERAIREAHPYEVPEILELRAARGLKKYLHWITGSVRK